MTYPILLNYMNLPKITIITISFNAVKTIEQTILSVINQTYSNIEYIIIDGCSTDGTIDIIKKYSNQITTWISEPDKGIYDAMNKGINVASGEWINFMNSGDSFYNNNVIKEFIDKISPNTEIAYGDTMILHTLGNYIKKPKPLNQILKKMIFGHQATFIKAQLHKKYIFDTNFRSSADYNFFYKMYNQKHLFQYIPIVVTNYDATSGMSTDNYHIVKREDAIIQGKTNFIHRIIVELNICIFYFKQSIKKILPQEIIAQKFKLTHHIK